MTTLYTLHRTSRYRSLVIGGPRIVQLPIMVTELDPISRKPISAEKELCSIDLLRSIFVTRCCDGAWTDNGGRYFKVRFLT